MAMDICSGCLLHHWSTLAISLNPRSSQWEALSQQQPMRSARTAAAQGKRSHSRSRQWETLSQQQPMRSALTAAANGKRSHNSSQWEALSQQQRMGSALTTAANEKRSHSSSEWEELSQQQPMRSALTTAANETRSHSSSQWEALSKQQPMISALTAAYYTYYAMTSLPPTSHPPKGIVNVAMVTLLLRMTSPHRRELLMLPWLRCYTYATTTAPPSGTLTVAGLHLGGTGPLVGHAWRLDSSKYYKESHLSLHVGRIFTCGTPTGVIITYTRFRIMCPILKRMSVIRWNKCYICV
jgi:hypothetical protein